MKYEDRYYKISRDRLIYLLWLEHQVEAKKQREINYLNRMNNLPEYELPPFDKEEALSEFEELPSNNKKIVSIRILNNENN